MIQSDPASTMADLLIRHATDLLEDATPAADPESQSAARLWVAVSGQVKPGSPIHAAIDSQDEAELAENLRMLFQIRPDLATQCEAILLQRAGRTVDTAGWTPGEILASSKRVPSVLYLWLWMVLLWFILLFLRGVSVIAVGVLLLVRGTLMAYYARRLEIDEPIWLGIATLFPNTVLLILLMLSTRQSWSGGRTTYAPALHVITYLWLAVAALAIPVMSLVNPDYVGLYFRTGFGIVLFAGYWVGAAAALLLMRWGIWKANATTGRSMAVSGVVLGLCSTLLLWIVLLGPAWVQVQLIQM